ncbi:MAG: hypothetical protein WEA09_00445 [Gemmatimonadota bacterium]
MSDGEGEPAPERVRGVVVSHGTLAAGLVDAVDRITGLEAGVLVPVSNHGRGPDELARLVMEAAGDGPAVIFADLHSGSCALAARFGCSSQGNAQVVCGVNLPMLLDFVFHRDLPLDELVPRLVKRGREAVRALPPSQRHVDSSVPG